MNRRQSLGLMGTVAATLAFANAAQATTARAVSLPDLVRRSTRIARATTLESFARSEEIGGTRHIVTYSRLRIDDSIQGPSGDSETLVRTLGGRVGDLGEIVHGEAELVLNETSLVFLMLDPNGVELVTAMAQGHYPVAIDRAGVPRLQPNRSMPRLIGTNVSAVAQLAGKPFTEARALVLGAGH
jgi:hypothetical protein